MFPLQSPFLSFSRRESLPQQLHISAVLERGHEHTLPLCARLLIQRMRQAGWCIHQIIKMCRSHNHAIRRWKRFEGASTAAPLMWIETLCIPVHPEHAHLRMKAINRMALIYPSAERVLILDEELGRFKDSCSRGEIKKNARILCSKWNGRCWTLQEGALARRCSFQLRNSAITIGHGMPRPKLFPQAFDHFCWLFLDHMLCRAAEDSTQRDRGIAFHAEKRKRASKELLTETLVRTWNEVGRRSTTKSEDIHAILANLTDFSAAQIMSLSTPVERTKMMLHSIGRFPLDVLYNDCPRPQAGGNHADRWVPSAPGPEPLVERVFLRCTKNGLVVEAKTRTDLPDIFLFEAGSTHSRFCFQPERGPNKPWSWVECVQPTDDDLPRRASHATCLIVRQLPKESKTTAPSRVRGARLLITGNIADMPNDVYVRYACPLTLVVRPAPPRNEQLATIPVVTASKLPANQKLIIEHSKRAQYLFCKVNAFLTKILLAVDEKACSKLATRSRGLYHGRVRFWLTNLSSILGCYMFMSILGVLFVLKVWQLPSDIELGLTVGAPSLLFSLAIPIFMRWRKVRAWNAWKASFDENWKPKPSCFERVVRTLCPSRRAAQAKQIREV